MPVINTSIAYNNVWQSLTRTLSNDLYFHWSMLRGFGQSLATYSVEQAHVRVEKNARQQDTTICLGRSNNAYQDTQLLPGGLCRSIKR